jgi:hypothetical protein
MELLVKYVLHARLMRPYTIDTAHPLVGNQLFRSGTLKWICTFTLPCRGPIVLRYCILA